MKFKLAIAFVLILGYASCIDTEERVIINKDNSGTYQLTMDMGNMLKMVSQMGGNDKDASKTHEKKDSTIYFKNFVDTSTKLSAEEKDMLREGSLRIKADEDKNEMNLVISLPFKNISQLPKLRQTYMAALDKTGVMNQLDNKKQKNDNMDQPDAGDDMPKDMGAASKSLNPAADAFTFSAAPGKISNKFTNKELFETKVAQDSAVQMMQSLSAMMGDMNYKTVFVLPKPVKKYTGNNAEVSADKKTVTFKTTLSDLLNRPTAGEFELEY
ncbi:MAG: hypothetical protein C5B52_15420 [Bacteroidetes bacterium]|nr:MAG: hypothetical protein C5B52_15420 [Bacteroidota bacterium]